MRTLSFLILLFLLSGCKSPFDPTADPHASGQEISIHYLKSLYKNAPLSLAEDYVIRGRVVSSDEQGNFRWSLIVEDDTGGVEVKIGLVPYYDHFPLGREVRIKCAGLVLGAYGGTIQLGSASANPQYETGFISSERIGEHVFPTETIQKITPAVLTAGAFSIRYVHCAVRVEGVQLIEEELDQSWGDGVNYTERHFQFLENPQDTLIVRTSPHAVFAGETLPSGSGAQEGVLTRFAGRYSLVLNEPQELTGERMD